MSNCARTVVTDSTSLTLPAPAKINLFLHIIGRRVDGYHELQTAFQFLQLNDELTFSLRKDSEVVLQAPDLDFPPQNNSIWRAAHFLRDAMHCGVGADIYVKKNIPLGAGLGGGSSDAATTLLALNQLWQTNLSLKELAEIGLHVGADVPVFIYGHAAWGEGIGERLQKLDLPERWCLLIIPNCSVATAEIYSAPELTRNTSPITIGEFLKRGGHNDCEAVVRKRYPEVDQAFRWLNQFSSARMTGTGACVYALFDTQEAAQAIYQQLPNHFRGLVTHTLNQSPVHKKLNCKLSGV